MVKLKTIKWGILKMVNLKDIQNAIIEKQKGLNADIKTLLSITKNNSNKLKEDNTQEEENNKELNTTPFFQVCPYIETLSSN